VDAAFLLADFASELALFAAAGFLLFAIDDLAVDLFHFGRRLWRAMTVYRRYPRAFARSITMLWKPRFIGVFVPAWDESSVIADMLKATLQRFEHRDYRIFVGYYRNDPATAAAIASVGDDRVQAVRVDADGPTTKADCLNHLYAALVDYERMTGRVPVAVVLHDAEDLVHPLELTLFDQLIDRAAVIQLPVLPLVDPSSHWISGHYCDEFAESHGKDLVVREAVGASIPLAGVGCAIERKALAKLAADADGSPFVAESMTEDYEMGLRLGALDLKTMFVRIPAAAGSSAVVASRGHFPASLDAAIRQKARWIGGIAFAGWDRLGWRGRWGERWMRMRDRRGPLAGLLLIAGYGAALLWLQIGIAQALGAPVQLVLSPALATLLTINAVLLGWRVLMRFGFVTATYGLKQGLLSIPRLVVGNVIAIMAVWRALAIHSRGGPRRWEKTRHIFPVEENAA
jgi:bacteriophage N4 adsorption protein B